MGDFSYSELPKDIQANLAIVNLQNKDDKRFK